MHIAPLDFPLQNVPFMADGAPWNRSNWIAIEFNLLYRWHSLVPDWIGEGADRIEPADFRNNNPLVIGEGDRGLDHPVLGGEGGPDRAAQHAPLPRRSSPSGPALGGGADGPPDAPARLASYNDYRAAFKLKPRHQLRAADQEPALRDRLRDALRHDRPARVVRRHLRRGLRQETR